MSATLPSLVTSVLPAGAGTHVPNGCKAAIHRGWSWDFPNYESNALNQSFWSFFPWVETFFSSKKATFSQHENDFDSHHSSSRESRSKRMMEAESLGSSKPPITERAAFPAWQGGMLAEGSPCPASDVENCELLF